MGNTIPRKKERIAGNKIIPRKEKATRNRIKLRRDHLNRCRSITDKEEKEKKSIRREKTPNNDKSLLLAQNRRKSMLDRVSRIRNKRKKLSSKLAAEKILLEDLHEE